MTALDGSEPRASTSDRGAGSHAQAARDAPAPSWAIELPAGVTAPARARSWVLSCLSREPIATPQDDMALIVSEMVTNSVVHARLDRSQVLQLIVTTVAGRYRITVIDPGCDTEPRVRAFQAEAAHGLGLRLVDQLSAGWGTFRAADGARHVWCDLPRRSERVAEQTLA
jgi:anti-sigma regulatory factor (Ser/Thr protein kinase)